MIELVVGPDDPEAARWAVGLNRRDGGRLAVVVPARVESLRTVIGEILRPLGITAASSPRSGNATEARKLVLSWLAAKRIDRVVLVHADWLPRRLVGEVGLLATEAGIEIDCLVRPGREPPYVEWASRTIGWVEFVAREARDDAGRAARDRAVAASALAPIGPLGTPGGSVLVRPLADPDGDARSAFVDLAGRLRRDGTGEGIVVRATRLVLRGWDGAPAFHSAARGAARALELAGYSLWTDPQRWPDVPAGANAGPRWADLTDCLHPHGPAAIALLAVGLWPSQAEDVALEAVAEDGGFVVVNGHALAIAEGARPYVLAQRRLRLLEDAGPDEPFLASRGRPLRARGIAMVASALLDGAGLAVSPRALLGSRWPSARWLAEHGLVIRRETMSAPLRKATQCQHGLPADLVVDRMHLSHSQRLCLAPGPAEDRAAEVRPASAGYQVVEVRRAAAGSVHAVSQDGDARGQLVSLRTPRGLVWLQVGAGTAPPIDAIVERVALEYPEVLR